MKNYKFQKWFQRESGIFENVDFICVYVLVGFVFQKYNL